MCLSHRYSRVERFFHCRFAFYFTLIPCSGSIDNTFFLRIIKTVSKSPEFFQSSVHCRFIVVSGSNYKIKLLIAYFSISGACSVNQCFHLPAHGVKVYRCCHYDYISFDHFIQNFGHVIFLGTLTGSVNACSASGAVIDFLVFEKNLLNIVS